MKKIKIILIIMLLASTIILSGCTEKPTLDDCPCPEYDSDPTGGLLQPIETLQNLEVNISEFIDFSEIVQYYGQVKGMELERTAIINITFFNNGSEDIKVYLSLRNNSMTFDRHDSLFMDSTVWIQDGGITTYLYKYRGWVEDTWWCFTYSFHDYTFIMASGENRTIKLFYTLDEQPSGAFMDGQIFAYPYEVFGVHIGENHERWQYYPIEVRT